MMETIANIVFFLIVMAMFPVICGMVWMWKEMNKTENLYTLCDFAREMDAVRYRVINFLMVVFEVVMMVFFGFFYTGTRITCRIWKILGKKMKEETNG